MEQFCFGGQGNQNAYMLVYEKMLKRKMKIVLPQDIINLVENDDWRLAGSWENSKKITQMDQE